MKAIVQANNAVNPYRLYNNTLYLEDLSYTSLNTETDTHVSKACTPSFRKLVLKLFSFDGAASIFHQT